MNISKIAAPSGAAGLIAGWTAGAMRVIARSMKRLLPTLIVCLLAGAANAQQFGQQYRFLAGAGAVPCSEFANYYRNDPKMADAMFFSWAQGYISGINNALIRAHEPFY